MVSRDGCSHASGGLSAIVRVLYFGTYDRSYPRNAQVISALRGAGVDVVEQHRPVWERRHNWSVGLRQMIRVAGAERSLRQAGDADAPADALIVGYPGHFDLPAARRVARGRPVIFNPLVSLYDTVVDDRGRFRRGSPGAGVVHLVDRRAFRRADLVVADTDAQAAVLPPRVRVAATTRVEVCFVGAEERLFRPGWQPERPFQVLFVGKLIPLHGLETILAAAALVPEIPFRVVGSGQLESLLESRPANVECIPWVEYENLPAEIQAAGCALGIFGTGEKAARVIPNKAFQALACGTPLVTADTPAARELLADGKDALLVPPGDAVALARAVRRLAEDASLPGASRRRRPRDLRGASERVGARSPLATRDRAGNRSPMIRPRLLLWGAVGAFAAGMSALAVLQQRAFETGRFDVGNLTQAVWSTAHGRFLEMTDLHGEQISRLGAHFDPAVVLLVPLWWVWPNPSVLLVVQATAVALGAVPVFLLARKHLGSRLVRPRLRPRLPPLPADAVARRRRLPPRRPRDAAPARRDLVPRRGPAAALRSLRRQRPA